MPNAGGPSDLARLLALGAAFPLGVACGGGVHTGGSSAPAASVAGRSALGGVAGAADAGSAGTTGGQSVAAVGGGGAGAGRSASGGAAGRGGSGGPGGAHAGAGNAEAGAAAGHGGSPGGESPGGAAGEAGAGGGADGAKSLDSFTVDGGGCPMNHCTREDDSFQDLPPLLTVSSSQKLVSDSVSPEANDLLGCYSGVTEAVCAYSSPSYPALVAYDYTDGSVRWSSPLEDLQGSPTRSPGAVLLANVAVDGNSPRRLVYAANLTQIAAYYAESGAPAWSRLLKDISSAAPTGLGEPTSLELDDDKELVFASTDGWVVKLNPATGATVDSYRLSSTVAVGGKLYSGVFGTINSTAVLGNVLYMNAEFKADAADPLPDEQLSPVVVLRVNLTQPGVSKKEQKIRPITQPKTPTDPTPDRAEVGVHSAGGSPPVWPMPSGDVLIVSDADAYADGQRFASIAGVRDSGGVLSLAWRTVFKTPDDDIVAAPTLDESTGTLLLSTKQDVYVFQQVDLLSGDVPAPAPIPTSDLITCRNADGSSAVAPGSPLALSKNPDTGELVAYTNFRVTAPAADTYGYLGAFALDTSGNARPLFCVPLGLSDGGDELAGQGTYGQAALFRYGTAPSEAKGLIVNTVATGTYLVK